MKTVILEIKKREIKESIETEYYILPLEEKLKEFVSCCILSWAPPQAAVRRLSEDGTGPVQLEEGPDGPCEEGWKARWLSLGVPTTKWVICSRGCWRPVSRGTCPGLVPTWPSPNLASEGDARRWTPSVELGPSRPHPGVGWRWW